MSTGLIVAIVVLVLVVIAVVAALPRLRAAKRERELQGQRDQAAELHRGEAEKRKTHAERAEMQAQRARSEADALETKAQAHEQGLADDELDPSGEGADRDAPGATHREAPGSDAPRR